MTAEQNDVAGRLSALLSDTGRELLARLAGEDVTAGSALAVGERLRREYPARLVDAAVAQHELRLAARPKFSRAMQMLFTRPGLEQASSETVARHRAARYAGLQRVADLCCGIGGDLLALAGTGDAARAARTVLAVDREAVHVRMALHNAAVYRAAVCNSRPADGAAAWDAADREAADGAPAGASPLACVADVRELRLAGLDAVFVDPARRADGRRLRAGSCEPPLDWCIALAATVPAVGIKAAPGLPHGLIPAGWEAEFVAEGRDLKEAALWSPALATAPRRATVLPSGDTLVAEPGAAVPIAEPGGYLLDPSPAVTRAGLVQDLARALGAWQIDPRIAFLSANSPLRSPFGRPLRVIESAPWNERDFARRLRAIGVGAADLRRRGLAGDVSLIHRRLRLSGPHHAVVILTRVSGRPWGLICAPEG